MSQPLKRSFQNGLNKVSGSEARHNQVASDNGPIPNHSLFTGTLIHAIKQGDIDPGRRGFVTSSDLGLFLQQYVGGSPGSNQTPDFGAFYSDERGEMVIRLPTSMQATTSQSLHRNQELDEPELISEDDMEVARAKVMSHPSYNNQQWDDYAAVLRADYEMRVSKRKLLIFEYNRKWATVEPLSKDADKGGNL